MAQQIRQPARAQDPPLFSDVLQAWLETGEDRTLAGLSRVFAEKAFAIIFLLMMALAALPIPTGGLTHLAELVVMLLSLELIAGRRAVWLPRKWLGLDVGKFLSAKATRRLIVVVKWFERFSRRRWSRLLTRAEVLSALGLAVLVLTAAAFVAPPFTGLDTLPALGVVVISLAIILEDSLIAVAGIGIGVIGIGLEIAAGTALYSGLTHFL